MSAVCGLSCLGGCRSSIGASLADLGVTTGSHPPPPGLVPTLISSTLDDLAVLPKTGCKNHAEVHFLAHLVTGLLPLQFVRDLEGRSLQVATKVTIAELFQVLHRVFKGVAISMQLVSASRDISGLKNLGCYDRLAFLLQGVRLPLMLLKRKLREFPYTASLSDPLLRLLAVSEIQMNRAMVSHSY